MEWLSFITWNTDPVLLRLGSLEIRWYGLLLALGFLLAYSIFHKMVTREGLSEKLSDKFAVSLILWTVEKTKDYFCI